MRPTRKDLQTIWRDGMAWSVMVGMGEPTIPACALAIGATSVVAGLSSTLPMVLGAALQLILAPCVSRVRSLKRWVVLTCALQAVVFLPIAIAAFHGSLSIGALYALATLYWMLGIASNPAWSTWVEGHVPRRIAFGYWASRQAWIHVFTMLGLLAAGWILRSGEADAPLAAFAYVFLGAFAARIVSAVFLAKQSELELHPPGARDLTLRELFVRFFHARDGRILVALLASQAALQFAQPYFLAWLLGPRGFDHAQAMPLLAAAVLGRFLSLPAWGRFAGRHSLGALFRVAGALCIPVTLSWILFDGFAGLFAAQVFGGIALGGFELATFLAFFARVGRTERVAVLSWYQFANALAFALGSLAGGFALARGGDLGCDPFVLVFSIAALLRLLAYGLVLRGVR